MFGQRLFIICSLLANLLLAAPAAQAQDMSLEQCGQTLSQGLAASENPMRAGRLLQASLSFCDTATRPDDNEFPPAIELFQQVLRPIGYGAGTTQRAAALFLSCLTDYPNMPAAGEELPRHVDMLMGCANGAEVTIGLAWADHLRTSVYQELLSDGFPPLESADVGDRLWECLVARVGSGDDLLSIRKDCGVTVASLLSTELKYMRGAVLLTTACTTDGHVPAPDDLVIAGFQTGINPEEACTCACPAPTVDTSPSAVVPEPPVSAPAPALAPAPPPAVLPQSPGKLWNVKVQAASGSTSTWIATWTLRPGTSNEFDVKQTRFDGSVTTYHLRVTIGSDNKVRAEAFGDMQGPSSCDQLVLVGTLAGNAVSDGTYTCVGYKGTWQGTVEGRG